MAGPPDLVLGAFHWLEMLGLLGGVGAFVVRRVGRFPPPVRWADPPLHLALGAALVGGAGGLVFQHGGLQIARVVAEGVALLLCVRGARLVATPLLLAVVMLPLTGHAARVEPAAGTVLVDEAHLLSAALWAGGILALGSLRPPGGWSSPEARTLLQRFGRVAFIAFAVTALTGVLRATEQLNGPSDLRTTSYGVVLSLKSAGVVVMLVLSSLGWRRGGAVAGLEAGTAVAVVGLTALLTVLPPPA